MAHKSGGEQATLARKYTSANGEEVCRATYVIAGDLCTLTSPDAGECSFLAYDHFRIGRTSGWLSGYCVEVLMHKGSYLREPIVRLPFSRFEVVDQQETRLVLRIRG